MSAKRKSCICGSRKSLPDSKTAKTQNLRDSVPVTETPTPNLFHSTPAVISTCLFHWDLKTHMHRRESMDFNT